MAEKSIKDLVSGYAADIEADRTTEASKKEEGERTAREKREADAKMRAAEDAHIDEFMGLAIPVIRELEQQFLEAKIDAVVVNWWADKRDMDRAYVEPPTMAQPKGRTCEKLLEISFANHPKDTIKRSSMLFCAGRCTLWPPGQEHKSADGARDAYVLYAGAISDRMSTASNWARRKEGLFAPTENMHPMDTKIIQWIVTETLEALLEESAKRRGK